MQAGGDVAVGTTTEEGGASHGDVLSAEDPLAEDPLGRDFPNPGTETYIRVMGCVLEMVSCGVDCSRAAQCLAKSQECVWPADDGWGTPLRIICEASRKGIESAGPDRKWGTSDDWVFD